MGYKLMGWTATRVMRTWDRLADSDRQRGQGTVEYVGIVVMVALLVTALGAIASKWSGSIGDALKDGLVRAIGKLVEAVKDPR